MVKYNLIVAMCRNNGIGFENKLPWNIKSDMKYFSEFQILCRFFCYISDCQ